MAISPLFKLYDPYGDLSSAAEFGALPGDDFDPIGLVPIRKRKPTLADLMPEEEKQSLLSQLAAQGTSGLSALGYILDTPGALVRGVLAGKPLSGFGSSEERVSGRDLLRQYGLAGDKDNWGNFSSGMLAEVALDPLSYIGIGLLGRGANTTAANLAKRAGLLVDDVGLMARKAGYEGTAEFLRKSTPRKLIESADDVDEATKMWRQVAGERADNLLDMPLTRTNRLSFPGFGSGAVDLIPEAAGDWLAKTSDKLGNAALATPALGPALRATQAMFDPRVLGFTDETGQWRAREYTDAAVKSERKANRYLAELSANVAREIGQDKFRSPEFAQAFRNAMENQYDQLSPEMAQLFRPGAAGHSLVQAAREYQDQALRNARQAGVKLDYTDLPNDIGYLFRQKALVDNPTMPQDFARPKNVGYDTGLDVFGVSGGTAQRRDYTRAFPAYVLDKMAQDPDLQKALREASNRASPEPDDIQAIIDQWLATKTPDFSAKLASQGRSGPFDFLLDDVDPTSPRAADAANQKIREMYLQLADSVRRTPLEYAENQIPAYGNAINDFARYVRSRARNEATADVLLRHLAKSPITGAAGDFVPSDLVPGGTAYSVDEALKLLNLDHWEPKVFEDGTVAFSPAMEAFARKMGRRADELTNVSFPKEMIDQLRTKVQRSRAPREAGPLMQAFDNMTQRFKTLALLWPARYSRDAYSGAFAGATQDAFNPLDWWAGLQARRGNYQPLARRLRNAPGYQLEDLFGGPGTVALVDDPVSAALPPGVRAVSSKELAEAQIRKFLTDAGGQGLTQASVSDDLGRMADNLTYKETFPGAAGGLFQNIRFDPRKISTWNPFALRTRQGNPNPLLELGDRVAEATDAGNRIGTYLNRIRKGDAPEAAKAIADLTQVNYSPSNFTAFERDFLKRILPFYSYTKGIAPLVAGELVNNPAGLMGQSIRAVTRASEPKPDQFTPEYLRQSAAIPIDPTTPLFGLNTPGITRFLTNLDLPHEGLINLFTPGIGNTLAGKFGDTLMKTGSNILGQSNPYLKGPLEWVMNRQFYSGRQLSDLYSVLEQSLGPTGRGVEQVLVNAPGGSRLVGTIRQLTDQRISPKERAAKFLFNALTGLKLQDVDQERTVRLAARTSLNQLLDQAQGMSTYENLFIKPEDLAKLSPQEQRQYLLYRVLQSEAAKKARDKKKQDALANPLAEFGLG